VKVWDEKHRTAGRCLKHTCSTNDGRALGVLCGSARRYERREVQVLGREEGRWVLASGIAAGEPVVALRAKVYYCGGVSRGGAIHD